MLIISGELDHTVPWAISNASNEREKRNEGVTEIVKFPNRGHALTIDSESDCATVFGKERYGGRDRTSIPAGHENRTQRGWCLVPCVFGRGEMAA
jgi:hypothetical protein